jgi:hypothetical protein
MLVELARRLCRPCYVIHNETKVYEFKPDGWDEERHKDNSSAIVYNVWGEHAFFYQTEAGPWAARLRVKTVTEVPTHRLAVLADDVPEITLGRDALLRRHPGRPGLLHLGCKRDKCAADELSRGPRTATSTRRSWRALRPGRATSGASTSRTR